MGRSHEVARSGHSLRQAQGQALSGASDFDFAVSRRLRQQPRSPYLISQFFSSDRLKYSFLMVCGSLVWRDLGKILSRRDLRLKYSGIRTYARAARPSSDRPGGRRSKNCWESSRACSELARSEILSKGCSSQEGGIFLWKAVEGCGKRMGRRRAVENCSVCPQVSVVSTFVEHLL